MSSTNVFFSELWGYKRDLALIDWCELPGLVKTEFKNFVSWGEFSLYAHEPEQLFNLLERFAIFNVVNYVAEAVLGSGLMEVKAHEREITYYLIYEYSYGAKELIRPTSLYMNCIANIVLHKEGVLQATEQNGSLPNVMQFHIVYYRKLHLHLAMRKISELQGPDLPWEIVEDLYLIQNLDEGGKAKTNRNLYETLERGIIFDVVNRLRLKGADDNLVKLFDQKYTDIRCSLIDVHYGYDLLHAEEPNFFERSLQSLMRSLPEPSHFQEMAERLRRIMKFHQEYYEDLFARA